MISGSLAQKKTCKLRHPTSLRHPVLRCTSHATYEMSHVIYDLSHVTSQMSHVT